jgi:DNA-binding transcriptional LysR family regulator
MDHFRAIQTFLAVAETSGFARAAAKLRVSPTAVTRTIIALEDQIGVRLFTRTTRRVRLTDAGALFAVDAKKVLADLAEAESSAAGVTRALRGQIRLTAPVLFGRMHVAPVLLEFMRLYPDITFDLLLADRAIDLVEEDVDVAVRIANLADSSLTAVRVGQVSRVLCASPEYLGKVGDLRTLRDLERANGIDLSSASARQWVFRQRGLEKTVRPKIVLSTTSPEVVIAAALKGLGVARFMTYQVRREIVDGRLQAILKEYETRFQPIHVVYHSQRHVSKRVRILIDHLKTGLRGQTYD